MARLVRWFVAIAALSVVGLSHASSATTSSEYKSLDVSVARGANRQTRVSFPTATYIEVDFDAFQLPEGDVVIVSNEDASVEFAYTSEDAQAFVASRIPGDVAIVNYLSVNTTATAGEAFHVAGFAYGVETQKEFVCVGGGSAFRGMRNAVCMREKKWLADALPQAYVRSKASVRIRGFNGAVASGFFVGNEGHILSTGGIGKGLSNPITNIRIEINAEAPFCNTTCERGDESCPPRLIINTIKLIANVYTPDLSYTLFKVDLPKDMKLPDSANLAQFQYLQLRRTGPALGERIYVIHHGESLATRVSTHISATDEPVNVTYLGVDTACGNGLFTHLADVDEVSSGGAILSWNDDTVVGIQRCGVVCQGTSPITQLSMGMDIQRVIDDLDDKGIVIRKGIVRSDGVARKNQPNTVPDRCPVGPWGTCGVKEYRLCCPSGYYCQTWNNWYAQCIVLPRKCSQQYMDFDLGGVDDVAEPMQLHEPGDCCAACANNPRCAGYSFVNNGWDGRSWCYLKNLAQTQGSNLRYSPGVVSGFLDRTA